MSVAERFGQIKLSDFLRLFLVVNWLVSVLSSEMTRSNMKVPEIIFFVVCNVILSVKVV